MLGSGTLTLAGVSVLNTEPTTSRNASHELSLDLELILTTGLNAAAALAGPPRGRRAAGQYAHRSSPQRPAAKLAPRGQARLWGTIATSTQRNATRHHATRTRWKVWGRYATGTQRDANAGYATRERHSQEGNAELTDLAQSRLREVWATRATDAGKGPNAARRD
jgi:hypothetical protein